MTRLCAIPPLLALLACAGLSAGCNLFDDDDNDPVHRLVIAISASDGATSPSNPVTFTVTAINVSAGRVVWGQGSSSCQLHAVVTQPSPERRTVEDRQCTADLVEQGLDPGESRTEQFEWSGWVVTNQGQEPLPAGVYLVRGAAGDHRSQNPVQITVQTP